MNKLKLLNSSYPYIQFFHTYFTSISIFSFSNNIYYFLFFLFSNSLFQLEVYTPQLSPQWCKRTIVLFEIQNKPYPLPSLSTIKLKRPNIPSLFTIKRQENRIFFRKKIYCRTNPVRFMDVKNQVLDIWVLGSFNDMIIS